MAAPSVDHRLYDPAVGILRKVLQECEEKGVDKSIRDGIELSIKLSKDRLDYCEKITTKPSETLQTLSTETITYPFAKAFEEGKTKWKLSPMMMSGSLEGKFLQSIVMMTQAKQVLEVGMFTGYGALACAEVLPEDGEVVTCDFDPFLNEIARGFFDKSPHGKKIDIRVGPASDTLMQLAKDKRQFDVIFIDANEDGYLEYYKIIKAENLLAENGIIAFDNALLSGVPYCLEEESETKKAKIFENFMEGQINNGKAIKGLNDFMMTQDDVFKVLLPVRDGVLLVQRKPKTT